ncbi:MAG: hypothetical protein ACERLM_14810 [Acidimicrobiales bacterium]
MSSLHPLEQKRRPEVIVRLHCHACQVAWSGTRDSSCWVCDGPGRTHEASVLSRRTR